MAASMTLNKANEELDKLATQYVRWYKEDHI